MWRPVAFDLAGGAPADTLTALPSSPLPPIDAHAAPSGPPVRSTTIADYVSSAFSTVSGAPKEPRHERARRLAHEAEATSREFMKGLDEDRSAFACPYG
jgi:hypothetical protein